jgi:hypothetical protein
MTTTKKTEDPTVEVEPVEPVETAETLADDIRVGLLRVVRGAVDPATEHGVDVVLASQAADVYQKLFGAGVAR